VSSPAPNLSAYWATCIAEELARAGVRDALLCPGMRNAALLWALRGAADIRCLVHVEERGAAFYALGLTRASERPTVVCTTSGSAVANLLPALVEAQHDGLPLILLSADRPARLHDAGAPQTMQQRGIFAPFLAADLDCGDADSDAESVQRLRHDLQHLLHRCLAPQGGPGHINVPIDEPVAPLPDADFQPPNDRHTIRRQHPAASTMAHSASPALKADYLKPGLRGLIVAGGPSPLAPADARKLAETTGFPVLADAISGLRRPAVHHLITAAERLLNEPPGDGQLPELLIRLGGTPTSRRVYEYCAACDCPVLRIDRRHVTRDFLHERFDLLVRPGPAELNVLGKKLATGDDDWRESWLAAERSACDHSARLLADMDWGELSAAHEVCAADGFALLHLGNSLPVRHADLLCRGREQAQAIWANRGVNGIDGTVATFLGELRALAEPGILLLGDLALLHDLPSLAAARDPALNGCIVVLNNDGGAIFDLLKVREMEHYQELIRTPQGLDFEHAAALFGLGYRHCGDREALREAIVWSREQTGVQLIECVVPPESAAEQGAALLGC